MKQLALDITPPPLPTLDNFVPGRNGEVVVALYALANGASNERFVHLWGEQGSGRTHLLRAVIATAERQGRRAEQFAAADASDIDERALVIADDVDALDAQAQVALFNVHNKLQAGGGALVTSARVAPAGMVLRPDLVTRLAAGLVYQVHALNDDEKRAALSHHARARGFELAPEVASYLLRHSRRDLPSLLALLDALDRHSLATKRAITVPLLRELDEAAPAGRKLRPEHP